MFGKGWEGSLKLEGASEGWEAEDGEAVGVGRWDQEEKAPKLGRD